MQETPSAAQLAQFLAHDLWLRRLAVLLARDDDAADDVAQQTWEAALKSPPDPSRPLRPWLAEVARNFVRKRARSWSRNQARLRDPALGADAPDTEALVERLEAQALIVQLVTGLEEPYRTVILLRFYDGKTPAEIAEVLKIPHGTARWRLKTGLDRLRDRLDQRCGTPEKRRAFLLLLSRPTGGGAGGDPLQPAGATAGTSAVYMGLLAMLGAATVAVFAQGWQDHRPGPLEQGRLHAWAAPSLDKIPRTAVRTSDFKPVVVPDEPLLEFDFEDGLLPSDFVQGHVVPTPPGGASRFCVIGTFVSAWPKWLHVAVRVSSLNLTFSRTAVLSFDYWTGTDSSFIAVLISNRDAKQNYGFKLTNIVKESWGHAEVRFADLIGVKDPGRPYEEGAPIDIIGFAGGLTGGKPFYLDNVKLQDVPR
jgi:RNA polymerase sigma-70 factor (ECF subfamily)